MDNVAFGFIGFGLIGGSIASAIHSAHPDVTLIAYDHHTTTSNENLLHAKQDQLINEITHELSDLKKCKIIFLCAPVDQNIIYLKQIQAFITPDIIITDIGSVKGNIHKAIHDLNMDSNFIGGHPMAGSEKTGYDNSNMKLLENAYYILTPTKETSQEKIDTLHQLVLDMRAIPILLDYNEHDDITACVSHVPHLIAAALVNMVKDNDDSSQKMKTLAAGGFKDITRIASSSPALWQSICMSNQNSIIKFLKQYISSLETLCHSLEKDEADIIYQTFDSANQYRSLIPNQRGLIENVYDIYLDIKDEAGSLATIAVLLATNNINIKNIGIIHNREFQQGVLRIELYNETSRNESLVLLKEKNYTIYAR